MDNQEYSWVALIFTTVIMTLKWANGQETSLCGPPGEWTLTNTTLTNTIPVRTDITLSCSCSIEPLLVTQGSEWGITIIPMHVQLATTQQSNDETLSICPSGGSLCDASTGYLRHSNPDPATPVTLEGPLIKFTHLTVAYTWKSLSAPRRGTVRIQIEGSADLRVRCRSNLGDRGPLGPDLGAKPTDPFLKQAHPSTPQSPSGTAGSPGGHGTAKPTSGGTSDMPLLHLILAIVVPLCVVFLVAILAVVLCLRRHNKSSQKDASSSQNCCVDGQDYSDTPSMLSSNNNLGVSVYHYNESMASLKPASIISNSLDKDDYDDKKREPPHVDPSRYLPYHTELTQHFENHFDHVKHSDPVEDSGNASHGKATPDSALDQAAVPVEDVYARPYKKTIVNNDKEENASDVYAKPNKVKNGKVG